MNRRFWLGFATVITASAALPGFGHAQSAANIPAPLGCFWRPVTKPDTGKPRLRCQLADGTWTYWGTPYFNEHTVADAQAGDPWAMTVLGNFYDVNAPKNLLDPHAAMDWYQKAAAKGYGPAMTQIGLLYEVGTGFLPNEAEAVRWLLAGANAGDPKAMFMVGVRYERGEGLPKDEVLARHWHLMAAERGGIVSMLVVAKMYRDGTGGAKDPAEAVRWSERHDEAWCAQKRSAYASLGVSEPVACDTDRLEGLATDRAKLDAESARLAAEAATVAAAAATQAAADAARMAPKCATSRYGC